MRVENVGMNYLIRQVVRDGIEYTIEFVNKNDTCVANLYKYDKHKVLKRTKSELLYSGLVGTVTSYNGNTVIEDVTSLTDYGFKKHASDIIDAVFDSLSKGEINE